MGSIGAVPASKFGSPANRINASRTLSRGTPIDLAYAARILRIARLESESFERQARRRWNFIASGFGFEILRRGSQHLRANAEHREQNAAKEPARFLKFQLC